MDTNEIEKSKAYNTAGLIEYVPNAVVSKTILKKATGSVRLISSDSAEGLTEKITPFDTFIQIIDGKAEVVISGESYFLQRGQSIVIPAHAPNTIQSNGQFKMLLTIIKSGYE